MIKLNNWQNNDIVHHSLVLFKGGIKNVEHGEIFIAVNEGRKISWPIICYSFRALVELETGENQITLQCGTQIQELKLTYKRQQTDYVVRLVYIVCSNSSGCFQGPKNEDCSIESACSKLSFGAKVIQSLTAEKICNWGLKPRTFRLEEDKMGKVKCHVFRSNLTVEETHSMDEQGLWDHFATELMNSELKMSKCKFLAFLSSTRYIGLNPSDKLPVGHSQVRARTRAHVALGGGGLALIGTACLYTWPFGLEDFQTKMEDTRIVDKTCFMDDSCNRSQLWACYISGLGAALHELAHTFDVGHSGRGIMGLGFHQLQQELQVYEQKTCCVCPRNAHFHEPLTIKHNEPVQKSLKPKVIQWITPCPHCPDGPFWNPSSAWIMYYHKWFLTEEDTSRPLTWEETQKGWNVTSVSGLAVAELRDTTGLVLAYWHIRPSQAPPISVRLPKGPLSWKAHSLVVQDTRGNLLKIEISAPLTKTLKLQSCS